MRRLRVGKVGSTTNRASRVFQAAEEIKEEMVELPPPMEAFSKICRGWFAACGPRVVELDTCGHLRNGQYRKEGRKGKKPHQAVTQRQDVLRRHKSMSPGSFLYLHCFGVRGEDATLDLDDDLEKEKKEVSKTEKTGCRKKGSAPLTCSRFPQHSAALAASVSRPAQCSQRPNPQPVRGRKASRPPSTSPFRPRASPSAA